MGSTMAQEQSRKQTTVCFTTEEELDRVREAAEVAGLSVSRLAQPLIMKEAIKILRGKAKLEKCPTCGGEIKRGKKKAA